MTLEQCKKYFGRYSDMMKQMGLCRTTYLNWRIKGYIPYYQQVQIEKLTNGELKASIDDYVQRGGIR